MINNLGKARVYELLKVEPLNSYKVYLIIKEELILLGYKKQSSVYYTSNLNQYFDQNE